MNIDNVSMRLGTDLYYSSKAPRKRICLHHTAGGTARSSFEWWESQNKAEQGRVRKGEKGYGVYVGTSILVDRDGTWYEVFPRDLGWMYQLGIRDVAAETTTIGIELASWGALTKKPGGNTLFAFGGADDVGDADELVASGKVVKLGTPYRGFEYFEAYTKAQIGSVLEGVPWLCDQHGIPRKMAKEVVRPLVNVAKWRAYEGVVHHAMFRQDRTDLHPGFPFADLAKALGDVDWV